MRRFFKVLGGILLGLVLAVGALVIATEGLRRESTVRQAVEAAKAAADDDKKAAVAKAVAAAEAKVKAAAPTLPKIESKLVADDETRALFPTDSYLSEVTGGKYQDARCADLFDMVFWMRLRPEGQRSTMERQKPDASRFLVGLLSFGLSEVYTKGTPIQTIFSATTDGPYTTIILGALRGSSDDELVGPQFRLTLYRLDKSSFGVVERAPVDEPVAARPLNRAPKMSKVFRRCLYQDGVKEL